MDGQDSHIHRICTLWARGIVGLHLSFGLTTMNSCMWGWLYHQFKMIIHIKGPMNGAQPKWQWMQITPGTKRSAKSRSDGLRSTFKSWSQQYFKYSVVCGPQRRASHLCETLTCAGRTRYVGGTVDSDGVSPAWEKDAWTRLRMLACSIHKLGRTIVLLHVRDAQSNVSLCMNVTQGRCYFS